jgi:peptidoglycan hydrolase-like protein with peptidoglycan-binding domain
MSETATDEPTTGEASVTASEPAPLPLVLPPKPRGSKRKTLAWLAVLGVVVAGGVTGYAERSHFEHQPTNLANSFDNSDPVSYASVTRENLTSQTQVNGTLGYAGTDSVIAAGHAGTLTALPAVGQVITQGHDLYSADGAPVVLLYGRTPAYRDLAEGDTGTDVQQLNAALVALGYADSSQIDVSSDTFSWETKAAVENLQAAMGVTQDGTLHLGQAVFLPGPLRVTTVQPSVGAPAQGTILQGTSTTRQVTVALDASLQSQVKAGDAVTITLPDNSTTQGTVASVGTVATAGSNGSSPTVQVEITLKDAAVAGGWDQAPVQVSVTNGSAANALAVPVTALLALSGGGYGVEVVGAGGSRRLVAVTLGMFDDAAGLVQVTDTGLRPGERLVEAGQ